MYCFTASYVVYIAIYVDSKNLCVCGHVYVHINHTAVKVSICPHLSHAELATF